MHEFSSISQEGEREGKREEERGNGGCEKESEMRMKRREEGRGGKEGHEISPSFPWKRGTREGGDGM